MQSKPLTVWIEELVLAELADEADEYAPKETGGVLLGHRNGAEVVVRRVLDAGPNANRWATGMKPDNAYQTSAMEAAFLESDGAITYLGDWHSHPGGINRLSRTDRRTLKNIASETDAFCPEPVMLLLSRPDELRWVASAWSGGLGWLGRWGRVTLRRANLQIYGSQRRAIRPTKR